MLIFVYNSQYGSFVKEVHSLFQIFYDVHHLFQCKPVPGRGFIPGAYKCFCEKGYYFPVKKVPADEKYFSGEDLERFFTNTTKNDSTNSGDTNLDPSLYQCLKCAEVR